MNIKFTGSVDIEAAAPGPRKLAILAYTGGQMSVDGFGPLVLNLAGMTLPSTLPILSDHKNEIGSIIASGSPVVSGGTLSVKATLADSPAASNVVALLASGVSLQASVGAQATAKKYIAAGDKIQANGRTITAGNGGLMFIEKSVLKEISITPLGADASTSVSLTAKQERQNMSVEKETPPTIETAIADERKRVAEVDRLCAGLNFGHEQQAKADDLRAKAISGEISTDVLRDGLLQIIRASRAQAPAVYSGKSFAPTANHLSAALMVKAGFSGEAEKQFGATTMQQSQHLHGASLVDLCRAALQIDGKTPPTHRSEMIRASLSSGSLPVALGDSANKVLAGAYRAAPASWRAFASVKSAPNFKEMTSLRPSFAGDLQEVAPGGEVKHQSYSEETFSWQLGTYARQLQIGRQQILNDDASAFSEVIPSMGKAASRTLSNKVAEVILGNAGSFWATGSGNYQEGAGTALSSSSMASAIKLLRNMKDAENNLLDLTPQVLLVPSDLEPTARALLQSTEVLRVTTDQLPTGNIYKDAFQLAVEPRLSSSDFTGYSTTGWYLFSDPSNAAIVVAFLDGVETPMVETFDFSSDINSLALGFRVVFDFGVSLADFRSSIFSKGAA